MPSIAPESPCHSPGHPEETRQSLARVGPAGGPRGSCPAKPPTSRTQRVARDPVQKWGPQSDKCQQRQAWKQPPDKNDTLVWPETLSRGPVTPCLDGDSGSCHASDGFRGTPGHATQSKTQTRLHPTCHWEEGLEVARCTPGAPLQRMTWVL